MLAPATLQRSPAIIYPDSDGKPMSDNTKQARWMAVLFGNLSALFHAVSDVFVAMDLLWYATEGDPGASTAPDTMVAFGRPKGDRGSYKQWEEEGVPVTVAFEILSPSNDPFEMADKLAFYDQHGVEEYYLYDPQKNRLAVYLRGRETLVRRLKVNGFVSPRLGIRFDLSGPEMAVFYPDGRRFLTFEDLEAERQREQQGRLKAEQRAENAEQRAARLAALSSKLLQGQATSEERQELQRLLDPPPAREEENHG
jgi:Uma2 family endonuclease